MKEIKYVVVFAFVLIYSLRTYSQQVTAVDSYQDGKNLKITYNLTGKQGVSDYEVKLFVSTDDGGNWQQINSGISGDVGAKVAPGINKLITWNVLATRERLQGDKIRFKVTASYNESGNYTESVSGLNLEMVFVQGGTFTMGCTSEQGSDCYDDEKPAHSVTVGDFYIGKYEVTQKQWRAVMGSDPPELYFKGCDNCPVERVSWNDIQEFLKKLNAKTGKTYRLPTEAEWEYAARGGSKSKGYKYSGSNNLGSVAWYTDNSGNKTHPVGQKLPNELGIYDMSGNVWEWCSDWYANYNADSQTDPKGPTSGSFRVYRGGGWYSGARYCRSANRNFNGPDNRNNNRGFRLAVVF